MAYGERTKDHYNDKELQDVIVDFLLAGRDTNAVTLAWVMYELCCHPEIVDKIDEEGSKRSVYSTAVQLTHDTLGKMLYLQAAFCESLRLHPPVPRDGKVALVDDVLPDGTLVKKGDLVPYVPYSMERMPFMWGSDALEVKPERWLKDGVFDSVSPFIFTTLQSDGASYLLGLRFCLLAIQG